MSNESTGTMHEASDATPNDPAESQQKRAQFGNRYLTNPENVFQHNAWDNVSWDENQLAEAQKKVDANSGEKVQQEMQEKYEDDADQFWNDFYSQHQNRFFKDRHWLFTEFPELANSTLTSSVDKSEGDSTSSVKHGLTKDDKKVQHDSSDQSSVSGHSVSTESSNQGMPSATHVQEGHSSNIETESSTIVDGSMTRSTGDQCAVETISQDMSELTHSKADFKGSQIAATGDCIDTADSQFVGDWGSTRILEVGCGVGNTVFPILQTNNDPGLFVYCCDFSDVAINIVKEHADYNPRRCHAFVCDITDETIALPFPENSLDIVILIFVLSAVHPDKMQSSINRLSRCLKPGGMILLRDYGRYDLAQLRFKKGRCLSEHFYVRGDGTRVYFFTQEELRDFFTNAGLEEEQNMVDKRLQVNRGRQLTMYRVWIQCKYRKPASVS